MIESRRSHFFLHTLAFLALAAHAFVLVCDRTIWDGWWLDFLIKYGPCSHLIEHTRQAGILPIGYFDCAFSALGHHEQVVRLLGWLTIPLNFLAIRAILKSVGFDKTRSLLIALLAISYPGFRCLGDITSLWHSAAQTLFLLAVYLLLQWNKNPTAQHRLAKLILPGILLLVSFNLNSLLPFSVYIFLLLFIQHQSREIPSTETTLGQVLRRNVWILSLPIVFWLLKEALTPRHGAVANYNALHFSLRSMFNSYVEMAKKSVFSQFSEPLRLIIDSPWYASFFAILLISAVYLQYRSIGVPDTSSLKSILRLFVLSLAGLGLSTFGYVAVNKPEFTTAYNQDFGWGSRGNLLVGFPLAISIYYLFKLITLRLHYGQKIFFLAAVSITGFWTVVNLDQYLHWQAMRINEKSFIGSLARETREIAPAIITITREQSTPPQKMTSSLIWTFQLAKETGRLRTFVHESNSPECLPVANLRGATGTTVADLFNATTVGYLLSPIDMTGRQIIVQTNYDIFDIPNYRRTALHYWRDRLFGFHGETKIPPRSFTIEIKDKCGRGKMQQGRVSQN